MKILLTNDDGIEAPGIIALHQAVQSMGTPIVVAPKHQQSGIGHQITAHTAIAVNQSSETWISVDGTPADCTRLGLKVFASEVAWLISGINAGSNLGSDIYQSGTVAAAREAAILGISAIAISQYIAPGHPIDWSATEKHAQKMIAVIMQQPLESGFFWNINLPHPLSADEDLPYRMCPPDINPHDYHYQREGDAYVYKGNVHQRPHAQGTDVAVCYQGMAAISKIAI